MPPVDIDALPPRVRIAVAFGELPADALEPGDDWPELFGSYDEMAAAQGG
jgi:hypothetical protein